ncbi:MAG: PA2779 family protein [Deltaproteobacteria bacterium]|nr:PA2779 family protein [Deltaproteobacteria bacterium]
MSRGHWLLLLFLILMIVTPVAAQQAHIADEATLDALIEGKLEEDAANRVAVQQLFERPEVRDVAEKFGLTPARVEAASAALDSEELSLLASYARTLGDDIVGGQWGGGITWFAIIAVLVVVIVLFAIAG